MDFAMSPPELPRNELPHALDLLGGRGIGLQEFFRQAHSAERHADCFFNALLFREGNLATAPAQVNQQDAAAGSGLVLHQAAMNEPAFLKPRNDLEVPSRLGFDPGLKRGRIARIAHGRSGHHA
jgi:hypothetical protein